MFKLSGNGRFVILLVVYGVSASDLHSRQQLIDLEISQWCDLHPNGRIYTNGAHHTCSPTPDHRGEAKIKTKRLDGVDLRVGVITGKTGYEYDCGGFFNADGFNPKDTYGYYILNLLREILGFKVRFVVSDTWGSYDESRRNWTGLVGLAQAKMIDLGSCHTTITDERDDVVDFLLSTLSSTRSFVYDPSVLPVTRDVFVLTFSPMLWLCFFSSTVLLVVCFRISTWAHSKLRPDHEPWSWVEVVMWANAAICQQSYSRHPKGSSCRTTFLIGYLITYLLYTGFAAGVTSHLAVQGRDVHLTFKDVVIMKLNLVIQSDGTQFDFLKFSPDPHAKALHSNLYDLLHHDSVRSVRGLFKKIQREKFIGFGTTVTLHNYLRKKIPHKSPDFVISRIVNSLHQKAFLLQKKSPYKEVFNYWILRLMESGLLDFGSRKYIRVEDLNCCQEPGWSSAGLGNVASAVIIFGGGWFFSIVLLFLEMAWIKRSTSTDWEVTARRDVYGQLRRKKLGK